MFGNVLIILKVWKKSSHKLLFWSVNIIVQEKKAHIIYSYQSILYLNRDIQEKSPVFIFNNGNMNVVPCVKIEHQDFSVTYEFYEIVE